MVIGLDCALNQSRLKFSLRILFYNLQINKTIKIYDKIFKAKKDLSAVQRFILLFFNWKIYHIIDLTKNLFFESQNLQNILSFLVVVDQQFQGFL